MITIVKKLIPKPLRKSIRREILNFSFNNSYLFNSIPHMGILLTSICNLNCRHCADLIPQRRVCIYKYEDFVSDMDKILKSVRKIKEVLLIGGEVFLYRDLEKVIDYCIKHKQIEKIIITTNGTIFPTENLWRLIENKRVVLRISGYDGTVAPKRENIVEECHKRKIVLEDLRGMVWYEIGNNQKRYRSPKELKRVFSDCSMKSCVTIANDGRVFFCSRQMSAAITPDYPDVESHEVVDVRNSNVSELKKQWDRFYRLPYISTCDYCDGINDDSIAIGTALQVMPKQEFISLVGNALDQNLFKTNKILIKDLLYKYRANMKDEEIVNDLLQEEISSELWGRKYRLFCQLIKNLSCDYRLCLGEKTYNEKRAYGPKNMINVKVRIKSKNVASISGETLLIEPSQVEKLKELFPWHTYE